MAGRLPAVVIDNGTGYERLHSLLTCPKTSNDFGGGRYGSVTTRDLIQN